MKIDSRRHKRRDDLIRRLEDLDDTVVARTAVHPRLQRSMSVIDWMYFVGEHDNHHLARAREIIRAARAAGETR